MTNDEVRKALWDWSGQAFTPERDEMLRAVLATRPAVPGTGWIATHFASGRVLHLSKIDGWSLHTVTGDES